MTTDAIASGGAPPSAPRPGAEGAAPTYPRPALRWAALLVVLAAEVMDLLDSLVTSIAGPSVRADLGGSESLIQWLGAGYTLAMAVGLITGGRLGDLFGRRRMFVLGAVGFTLASALCAAATNPGTLVTARILQGLLGAVMLPQGLGLLRDVWPPEEVGKAFGAFGPIMGLSSVGGPVLAGWLIGADFLGTGWRMIFLINLPIGILAVAGAFRFLPASRGGEAARLDGGGVLLAALGSLLVVLPLVQGRELGWPLWTFVSLAAGVLVFVLFGRHELRTARRGGDPLVVPGLFRKRAFTGSLLAGLAFFSGLAGFSLVLTLFLQLGLGYTPLRAGLAGIPLSIGMVAAFVAGGAGLAARLGRTLVHAGVVVVAAGVVGLLVTVAALDAGDSAWRLAPALTVIGFGMGSVMAPFFDIALAGVEQHENGSASGTLTAVQQLGSTLGVAVLGTVFFDAASGADPFGRATHVALLGELGLLAVTLVAVFAMPRRARPDAENAAH
jgi:EmrB/QacA subfamily drug resistance transporter